jgi:GNAT superfamily N-acetyltransferase
MNVIPAFTIELLDGESDLDGVLQVERESFTSPWTREMYAWELQNRAVCHIYILRTPECRVAGFCAFWLVFDEIHINNLALRSQYRGQGYGTALKRSASARGEPRSKCARATPVRCVCTSALGSTSRGRGGTITPIRSKTLSFCGAITSRTHKPSDLVDSFVRSW